jgi:glycerophosphoryl diester phosphodiesterase
MQPMKKKCLAATLLLSTFLVGCQTTNPGNQTMKIPAQTLEKLSVHGHRGSRGTHPENTLPAFQEAVASGAQVLELDMQLTKDDVVVISHEPDLTAAHCRYTTGKPILAPIPIRSITAKELGQFECGMVPQERFPDQKQIAGVPMPTLESFLIWKKKNAPKLEMNIETKMTADDPKWIPDPEFFARRVIATLKQNGGVEKAILQSFDFRTLAAAKKLEPRLRLSALFEHEKGFCEATALVGAQFASPEQSLVTAEEVARCHALKIEVAPWTANQPSDWKRLLECGVDAIITDYPRRLIGYLHQLRSEK